MSRFRNRLSKINDLITYGDVLSNSIFDNPLDGKPFDWTKTPYEYSSFDWTKSVDKVSDIIKNGISTKVEYIKGGGLKMFFEFPSFSKEDLNVEYEIEDDVSSVYSSAKKLKVSVKAKSSDKEAYKKEKTLSITETVIGVVDEENINSSFENGLLTITFPLEEEKEKESSKKKISIE